MDQQERIKARLSHLKDRLMHSAQGLLQRGAHGVAASIVLPGVDQPVMIVAGTVDIQTGAALTGNELFAIASQSKMFTAASVLLLEKAGALSLDDPVSRYVPEVPAVDQDATIAQFLNHTSGIGNFLHAMPVLPHPWPTFGYDDLMALARLQGRRFPAGQRLDYNNTDVVVLARLCELVSAEPRATFLQRRIFDPLGMKDTYVGSTGDWPRNRMAKGYYVPTAGYDGAPLDVSAMPDYTIASAAGDMISTLADMQRWAAALLDPENPLGISMTDFCRNTADVGAAMEHWFFPRTYANGVESWRWGGRDAWGHRGSFFGYHSGTFVEPVSGIAVTMFLTMCTQHSFLHFIDRLAFDYMTFLGDCFGLAADVMALP